MTMEMNRIKEWKLNFHHSRINSDPRSYNHCWVGESSYMVKRNGVDLIAFDDPHKHVAMRIYYDSESQENNFRVLKYSSANNSFLVWSCQLWIHHAVFSLENVHILASRLAAEHKEFTGREKRRAERNKNKSASPTAGEREREREREKEKEKERR